MKQSTLMIILTAIIIAVVGYGKYVSKNVMESATTVYEDRLVPQTQLSTRFDYYGTTIKDNFSSDIIENIDSLLAHEPEIREQKRYTDSVWVAYKSTYLTPEETALVGKTDMLMNEADSYTDMLLTKAKTQPELINDLVKSGELKRKVSLVLDNLNELIELQTRVGKEETDKMADILEQFNNFMIGTLSLALIMLGSIIYPMIRDRKTNKVEEKPTKTTRSKTTTKKPTTKRTTTKKPTTKRTIKK